MTSPTRTVGRALLVLAGATAFVLAGLASPAGAAENDSDSEPQVSVTGTVLIGSDKRVDGDVISVDGSVRVDGVVDGSVYVARGDVTVRGEVTGSILVLDGNVIVRGTVGDDVVVIRGRAVITDGARVKGDVSSSDKPRVASGAQVDGSVEEISLTGLLTVIGWVVLFAWWLAVTVSLVVAGIVLVLVFPRAAAAVSATGRSSIGKSVGSGALVGLVFPIVALGVLITILGIPLGIGLLAALSVAYPVGYLVTALVLGRLMLRRQPMILAFLLGFVVLRAVALLPGLGLAFGFLAALYGLGALAFTAWRAGRSSASPMASDDPGPDSDSPAAEPAWPAEDQPTVEA